MDGAALAARIRAELEREVAELGEVCLATVLVGDDPASEIYIRLKHSAAEETGILAVDRRLPEQTPEDELIELLDELNDDEDVDGLHPFNAGQLFFGRQTLVGATPLGIMRLLDEYRIPVAGARAVVVGRSLIVGRPVAMLLLHQNATVTICHSRTDDLARHTLDADILVAAVGHLGLITADMVKQGAAVIDVGINRTDEGLFGDVDPGVAEVAAFLTPVPGGVGPMTIACLLENTVRAARYRRGLLPWPGPSPAAAAAVPTGEQHS